MRKVLNSALARLRAKPRERTIEPEFDRPLFDRQWIRDHR